MHGHVGHALLLSAIYGAHSAQPTVESLINFLHKFFNSASRLPVNSKLPYSSHTAQILSKFIVHPHAQNLVYQSNY
jgi:hypothetical protein